MNELRTAPLLFIDCQTTGPYANGGNLLELGWQSRSTGRPSAKFSATVQLPNGATIPTRVRQLTGLNESKVAQGLSQQQVRKQLLTTLHAFKPVTLIIHYARFERPFLRALLGNECPAIYCTYAIAQRVLSRLPSFGIASLAGYFGAHLEKRNRAYHHVAATEAIYDGLVEHLEAQGIISFADLDVLLQEPIPRPRDRRWVFSLPRSVRLALPPQPGVYYFRDGRGRVLYVGKASSLKTRVNSYFQKRRGLATRQRELLTQVAQVDTRMCATAVHAALLECRDIQHYDPPYNRCLKTAGRQLAFCDYSLEQIATHTSPEFSIGPFANRWIPQSLNNLFHLLLDHRDDGGLFSDRLTTSDLKQGLNDFRQKLALKSLQSPRDLLAQGLRLLKCSNYNNGHEDAADQDLDTTVTPTKICERCQHILLNAAQHYRRARWLTRLLVAEVHWRENHVTHTLRLRDYIAIPTKTQNWTGLGVEAYDLARTLLSEIHRLRASGISVNLRLPGQCGTDRKKQSPDDQANRVAT
jgi:DNA polymerase-3 subunit epsilon